MKAKRTYSSPRRAAQAEQTQQAILAAARALFTSAGWSRTTIAAIAQAASVSNETVYSVFGSKRAILQRLITDAVRGQMRNVPLLEQPGPRRVAEEPDQRKQIALFAEDIAGILARVAPLMAVLRAAAEAEPRLSQLYRNVHRGRRDNLGFLIAALLKNGPLREGLDAAAATAIVWRLASPEMFVLLRDVEGLAQEAFAAWLADGLTALLLPADTGGGGT